MECIFCFNESNFYLENTYQCECCKVVFKNPSDHPTDAQEYDRYQLHENTNDNSGYINFLNKLLIPLNNIIEPSSIGIDFGCGPGPTLSSIMNEHGHEFSNYDPYFFSDAHLLIPEFYDVLTCTEVVEHFRFPFHSWNQLVDLVREGGYIGIMTQLLTPEINYTNWWYKNDITHVVFYTPETIEYIANKYSLEVVYNDNKSVIIFKKRES